MRLRPRLPHAAFAILLAVGSAQAADAITFLRMIHDHGPAAEANPFVAASVAAGAIAPLLLAKAGLVLLVVTVFALGMRKYRAAGAVVATLAVAAGLIGAFSNVTVLADAARVAVPVVLGRF